MSIKNKHQPSKTFQTSGSADLAFAVVVLASYFAMFSEMKETDAIRLILMVLFGIAYISLGIYGYGFIQRKNDVKWIVIYFLIQVPLGSFIVFLGRGAGFSAILLLPLAGHAVVLAYGYWLYMVNGFIILGYISAVRIYMGNWDEVWSTIPTILAGLIYIMVFTQMAMDEEKSRRQVENLVSELEDANLQLRNYADEIKDLAIMQERNRLAREIHDGLGHYLTTIHVQLQAAQAVLTSDPKKASEAIEKARNQSQIALLDVRKSVSALRFDSDKLEPIKVIIEKAMRPCEWVGISPHLIVKGEEKPVNATIHSTIFRILQETVNNTCKYSQAKNFQVIINFQEKDRIVMDISDDGIGSIEPSGGYGLVGLKERIELIDGKLEIKSRPQKGFSLHIEIPND